MYTWFLEKCAKDKNLSSFWKFPCSIFLSPEKDSLTVCKPPPEKDLHLRGPVLVTQHWQHRGMSTRSAPRSSFPEAASHPQCYDNQGGAHVRDRSCPFWEGSVQTSSWTSPEMNHLSKKTVPMSAVGSKNSSCTHANESSFCSLCFLLDCQQRGQRDCCFSIWE